MTPKEKAEKLLDMMHGYGDEYHHCTEYVAKQCALIAVNELIYFANNELLSEMFEGDYYCDVDFFEQVKKEIENL